MKSFFRKIVLFLLKRLAKRRLKKFRGKVIAVTGSIGKTSTKDAIFTVLNTQMKVKKNAKSMNTEFGLLLTILDIDSGFSSAIKWGWLLLKGFYHSWMKDHCEVLLLELGVDKPGDMDFLMSVVKPNIVVMTNIAPVHMEDGQFETLADIFNEKKKLIEALPKDGIAVLNSDDKLIGDYAKNLKELKVVTFGKKEDANYRASKVHYSLDGLEFFLGKENSVYEVKAKVLGDYQVYAIMPAIICGELMGMTLEDAITAVSRYVLPPGRMSVIPALSDAIILDSSYNSSPHALKEALKILKELGEKHRKIAVLGNMNELGAQSRILHEYIGDIVPKCADILITVGAQARVIAGKARDVGMDEKSIFEFGTALEAASFFKKKIEKNDLILVKGSQNKVRLENFIKEIMLHPEDAKNLLVRQEKVWQSKL